MLKVAITGGIASGKSTVCLHLEDLGYKVFYSDLEAKILVATNEDLRKSIKESFGSFSFNEDGSYNSSYIANKIFNDRTSLDLINNLFKPYIEEAFERFCDRNKEETLVFFEGATIFESNLYKIFDKIICCKCSRMEVIKRLKIRNNYTKAQIDSRVASQTPLKSMEELSHINLRTSSKTWIGYLESVLKYLTSLN